MSLTLHLNRFRMYFKVLSVTFCPPISMRCNDEDGMPDFLAQRGEWKKIKAVRVVRTNLKPS
ncbi:MAG TPA: hypothetical protein VIK53_03715 [Verrucomicrobiae bacterium]